MLGGLRGYHHFLFIVLKKRVLGKEMQVCPLEVKTSLIRRLRAGNRANLSHVDWLARTQILKRSWLLSSDCSFADFSTVELIRLRKFWQFLAQRFSTAVPSLPIPRLFVAPKANFEVTRTNWIFDTGLKKFLLEDLVMPDSVKLNFIGKDWQMNQNLSNDLVDLIIKPHEQSAPIILDFALRYLTATLSQQSYHHDSTATRELGSVLVKVL